jgi:hypothetical protein
MMDCCRRLVEERLDAFGRLICTSLDGVESEEVDGSDTERVREGVLARRKATFLLRSTAGGWDASVVVEDT